ncbi:MAG: CesT family type III secretion system chaperone [Planctomycetaceae bacterium]|nr:CesT family type III secretion system chaperone [Planctomycetaceae bacterium]
MHLRDAMRDILAQVSQNLGTKLQLDDKGVCSMVDGKGTEFALEIPESGEWVLLHAEVTDVPEEDREEFLERVLVLSAYGQQTHGCTLGLDMDTDSIVISQSRPVEMQIDGTGLVNLIGHFLDAVRKVRETLAADESPETDADAISAPSFPPESSLRV